MHYILSRHSQPHCFRDKDALHSHYTTTYISIMCKVLHQIVEGLLGGNHGSRQTLQQHSPRHMKEGLRDQRLSHPGAGQGARDDAIGTRQQQNPVCIRLAGVLRASATEAETRLDTP